MSWDSWLNEAKTQAINLALKFASTSQKLVKMFLNTHPSNIRHIVIIVITEPIFKQFKSQMQKEGKLSVHGKVINGKFGGKKISLIKFDLGAPNAAIIMEVLKHTNVKIIIRAEVCGSIDKEVKIGSIIIPISAFIGEGTSQYYLRNYLGKNVEKIIFKSKNSMDLLESKNSEESIKILCIKPHKLAIEIYKSWQNDSDFKKWKDIINYKTIWTTDALFCETENEIFNWKKLGASGVDMETSTMYLLSQLFEIPVLTILGVVDRPGDSEYDIISGMKIHPNSGKAVENVIKLTKIILQLEKFSL